MSYRTQRQKNEVARKLQEARDELVTIGAEIQQLVPNTERWRRKQARRRFLERQVEEVVYSFRFRKFHFTESRATWKPSSE